MSYRTSSDKETHEEQVKAIVDLMDEARATSNPVLANLAAKLARRLDGRRSVPWGYGKGDVFQGESPEQLDFRLRKGRHSDPSGFDRYGTVPEGPYRVQLDDRWDRWDVEIVRYWTDAAGEEQDERIAAIPVFPSFDTGKTCTEMRDAFATAKAMIRGLEARNAQPPPLPPIKFQEGQQVWFRPHDGRGGHTGRLERVIVRGVYRSEGNFFYRISDAMNGDRDEALEMELAEDPNDLIADPPGIYPEIGNRQ